MKSMLMALAVAGALVGASGAVQAAPLPMSAPVAGAAETTQVRYCVTRYGCAQARRGDYLRAKRRSIERRYYGARPYGARPYYRRY